MARVGYDPETLALDIMLRLDSLLREARVEKCSALARRADELPQLMSQAGLLQVALFYLSKSSDKLLSQLLGRLGGGGGELDAKSLGDECRREGGGYTLGLAVLAEALRRLGAQGLLGDASGACGRVSDARSLAECLLGVRRAGVELRAEELLEPLLIAVKRLAEALYKREG